MHNTTVLFSVLVLQWVTSKDNASTAFPSHHSQHTEPTSRSRSLHARAPSGLSPTPTYELGLRGHDVRKSRITTLVTTRNRGSVEEEERQRDLKMPKMAIVVQKDIDIEERLHNAGFGVGMARQGQVKTSSEDSLVP
jgi:hypothetical protein